MSLGSVDVDDKDKMTTTIRVKNSDNSSEDVKSDDNKVLEILIEPYHDNKNGSKK